MKITDALSQLLSTLQGCSDEQAQQLRFILEDGAGLMSLPLGAVLAEPAALPPARRETFRILADAVLEYAAGSGDFPLPLQGQWETVLASLVLRNDWKQIEDVVHDLHLLRSTWGG